MKQFKREVMRTTYDAKCLKIKKMYEEMYLLRVFMNVSSYNVVFKLNVSDASMSILLALLS
jgi:hypothetical protein